MSYTTIQMYSPNSPWMSTNGPWTHESWVYPSMYLRFYDYWSVMMLSWCDSKYSYLNISHEINEVSHVHCTCTIYLTINPFNEYSEYSKYFSLVRSQRSQLISRASCAMSRPWSMSPCAKMITILICVSCVWVELNSWSEVQYALVKQI